ncbi:MAG: type II secretion system F family protein [Phycisphaerae bacterium]
MAVYVYTARDNGEARDAPLSGTVTADSPRQARDHLRAQGLAVYDVTERRPDQREGRFAGYLVRRQVGKVTGLLQEMATLLAAGIPMLEVLDTITRQHSGRFQQAVMLLRDHVATGGSLAEAMALQPALFDRLCLNIVEVGENAGTLDASLQRLVEFRRRRARLKNRVAAALTYPCIVLAIGLGVSVFLMTYGVPKLLGVLLDSGKTLPMATVVVKAASDFLLGWWWAVLAGLAGLVLLVGAVLRTDRGRMLWDRALLKIPVFGDLVRKQAIGRMAMVMATLLESNVVFVRAVQIAQGTVRNRVLRKALEACEQAVFAGRDISVALERTDAFPPLVIQMFAVGQASGNLEAMLENLAADYDTQVDIASRRLTSLLEPVMTILLAIVVGFIAFATILPILEAGDVL